MPLAEPLIDSDIVIIVMGQIGSAKSTFINTLFGREVVSVGKSLEPCTEKFMGKFLTDQENLGADRLFIVDTPGLDHKSSIENADIIDQITDLLDTDDTATTRRAGIIFLHNIDSTRPAKPDHKQQELFQRFTDHNGWPCVVFGITMWNTSLRKEEEIQSKEQAFIQTIWTDILQAGAEIVQIHNGQSRSAWNAVKKIHSAIKQNIYFEEARKDSAKVPVILVLGQTGSGKSTFISVAGGFGLERKPRIGSGLDPCTKHIAQFLLKDQHGQYVRLIDTPGFNSEADGDQKLLKMIREWLRKEPQTLLKGVLFLDEDSKEQRSRSEVISARNIPRTPPANIWFITTKQNKRNESCESYKDAYVKHFKKTPESAWEIIGDVREFGNPITFDEFSNLLVLDAN